MFLTSPYNSVAAQIELFRKLTCKCLLSPDPRTLPVTAIPAACEVRVLQVPDIHDLFGTNNPHYPFDMNAEEMIDRPMFAV